VRNAQEAGYQEVGDQLERDRNGKGRGAAEKRQKQRKGRKRDSAGGNYYLHEEGEKRCGIQDGGKKNNRRKKKKYTFPNKLGIVRAVSEVEDHKGGRDKKEKAARTPRKKSGPAVGARLSKICITHKSGLSGGKVGARTKQVAIKGEKRRARNQKRQKKEHK